MYRRRRAVALGAMCVGVVFACFGFVDTGGWADIPGANFAGLVLAPLLVASGSMLHSSARYAEGEARREASRLRS